MALHTRFILTMTMRLDMHKPALRIAAALLLCASVSPAALAKTCTGKQADAAEAMVDRLDTWEQFYQFRKQYGHCDDGGLSELISGAVAMQLENRWSTLPELAKFIKHDRALKAFVIRHVNGTLDISDTEKIQSLATSSCPADLTGLCADLKKAAVNAFK